MTENKRTKVTTDTGEEVEVEFFDFKPNRKQRRQMGMPTAKKEAADNEKAAVELVETVQDMMVQIWAKLPFKFELGDYTPDEMVAITKYVDESVVLRDEDGEMLEDNYLLRHDPLAIGFNDATISAGFEEFLATLNTDRVA